MKVKPITNISFKRYNPNEYRNNKKDIKICGLRPNKLSLFKEINYVAYK